MQTMNIARTLEALALIEVYLGLVQQRVEQIKRDKNMPPELRTAITSIVYAANRVESLPELRQLRKMFERKYGVRELKAAAGDDLHSDPQNAGVAEKLMICVNPGPPDPLVWVQKGLAIAEEQGIDAVTEKQLYQVRSWNPCMILPACFSCIPVARPKDEPPDSRADKSCVFQDYVPRPLYTAARKNDEPAIY
jgi:hypothetical protein